MEYKRLTFIYESVDGTKEVGYTEKLIPCFNKQAMILNRLAELEDKIEQGYIKILPVKAGDKIYVVPSKVNFDLNRINRYHEHNRVYEQTVDEIRFFKNGVYMVYSCYYQQNHHSEFFGETWFLTREEAKKRLKELQNG